LYVRIATRQAILLLVVTGWFPVNSVFPAVGAILRTRQSSPERNSTASSQHQSAMSEPDPAWQDDPFFKAFANLFAPETRDDLSPEENRVVKLCCKGTGEDAKGDADYAEQLDDVLTAAAARGKPINLNILSQSGQMLMIKGKIQLIILHSGRMKHRPVCCWVKCSSGN